ncbi:diaminopropionate ammonia-lyase [Aquimarina sp. EL_43]|uniref:diaminopropionate ammonia-lyase n=1 Tax=unclassified Aquimarina TaxID=2627091 RepID=UPI0018C8E6F4|nr:MULTISPECIES: diaminopropionate ammonia-lyase [unclassified Aquimarina]MBG6129759.1 diaminopropionate ammonia-lyase [Aquimarina sp. EL_35]MBG6150824.1 diaminopropionate ammonia-lyase [Aquimarina sp. EL_32]MBG6167869.1 diaminopropionate ammonia-lyase [Aquimarina sp. EL_43]
MEIKNKEDSSFYINNPDNTFVDNVTTAILEKCDDTKAFHASLPGYKPTPLIPLPNLSKKYNVGNIYIKDESFRFGLNAFKGLGASYAIHQILKKKPQIETFCTATDGNHGRAVAWSANFFNKKAVVFVPKGTTNQRIKAIEKEGAIVEQVDGNYDKTCAYAKAVSEKNGWELVQDTAWENYEEIPAYIMGGYLTLFQEMENSLHLASDPKIDLVFLQAGVGSFAGTGIRYYLERYGANRPKIIIVEPTEADAILASFKKGKITTSLGNSETIMAGLNCGTPSLGAWDLIKNGSDVSIKIDDKYSREAIRELYFSSGSDTKIISGESGASGLAGFIAIMKEQECKPIKETLRINETTNILFISTEGATDMDMFDSIISEK